MMRRNRKKLRKRRKKRMRNRRRKTRRLGRGGEKEEEDKGRRKRRRRGRQRRGEDEDMEDIANVSYQRLWYESCSFIIPDIFQIVDESLFFSERIFLLHLLCISTQNSCKCVRLMSVVNSSTN